IAPGVHSFTSPTLAEGAHRATATFTSMLGTTAQTYRDVSIDTQAPQLLAGSAQESTPLSFREVHFSEAIASGAVFTLTGPGGIDVPVTAIEGQGDTRVVRFAPQTAVGVYVLRATGVVDLAGNAAGAASQSFTLSVPDTTSLTLQLDAA